jgi:dCMP deaminase
MSETTSWDLHHIKAAEHAATKSKDPSTKVGCVIIGPDNEPRSSGFNGFPRGVIEEDVERVCVSPDGDPDHPFAVWKLKRTLNSRWERPEKYSWIVHAEANAIFNAARVGIPLKGCKLYLNYSPASLCTGCAGAIIQAGIVEVIGPDRLFPGKGTGVHYDIDIVPKFMFDEAGIIRRVVKDV